MLSMMIVTQPALQVSWRTHNLQNSFPKDN